MTLTTMILIVSVLLYSIHSVAAIEAKKCVVKNSNGTVATPNADSLYQHLMRAQVCPEDVQSLKTLFSAAGSPSKPSMVANRGIHNPNLGSFSFFETVDSQNGEIFFGHFTGLSNGIIVLDQEPTLGKLLIELISWDPAKKLYNFYELIGAGRAAEWFYRGDSADILRDNANLHMTPPGTPPKFGNTLRCSACHTSGGPIMKEISAPHNDWWTNKRPLPFGNNKLSSEVSNIVAKIEGAETLTHSVRQGIQKLESSPTYQKLKSSMPLKAQLRPLFCEVEVNLMSDLSPLQDRRPKIVQIPSASIVNPLLKQAPLTMDRVAYEGLLTQYGMSFPETTLQDADHAWLVPVKGYSDLLAIQSLIKNGTISSEFVADVLAIDAKNPLFSAKRCGLLQLVPLSGNFAEFTKALHASPLPEANELLQNLSDQKRNSQFHSAVAEQLLEEAQTKLTTRVGQKELFEKLLMQRRAVFNSVISKNPRGQILEPGFRVIFPETGQLQ